MDRCVSHTLIVSGIFVLGASGCARSQRLDRPLDWPDPWSARRLFTRSGSFAYATSESAANETDDLAARVAKSFHDETSASAPPGLIIVTDAGDPPVIADGAVLAHLYVTRATGARRPSVWRQRGLG